MLASLSSGGGELSFLALTHFYGPFSLAAWGSGTGAAGLVGAGVYAMATTSWGFSVKATLLASAFLPAVMVVSFFVVLPRGPLRRMKTVSEGGYQGIPSVEEQTVDAAGVDVDDTTGRRSSFIAGEETAALLASSLGVTDDAIEDSPKTSRGMSWALFKANLKRAKGLFFPLYGLHPSVLRQKLPLTVYSMLPLLLVYIAEYTINQGVAPTLLFPLEQSPFNHYRAFYPTYNAIYQVGVFISRSSTPFFRIHNLYLPSFLQVANLAFLTLHALFNFLPNVWIIFAVMFWEGLLGGLVYVNTFAEISERVAPADREFSLGATTVSDSGGICIAGLLGMVFEVWLCRWQVARGRDYCMKI
jgi:battenin